MAMRETAPLQVADLPIEALSGHLRLGTALAGQPPETDGIERAARAALALVEGRVGRALIAREFLWRITQARAVAVAPLVPLIEVTSVDTVTGGTRAAATGWHATDEVIVGLPDVPRGGMVEIVCRAGFGTWDEVPADLREAVLLVGAALYEARGGAAPEMPEAADLLLSPWRRLSIGGAP